MAQPLVSRHLRILRDAASHAPSDEALTSSIDYLTERLGKPCGQAWSWRRSLSYLASELGTAKAEIGPFRQVTASRVRLSSEVPTC